MFLLAKLNHIFWSRLLSYYGFLSLHLDYCFSLEVIIFKIVFSLQQLQLKPTEDRSPWRSLDSQPLLACGSPHEEVFISL